ncbi:PD-(D/E)XK nuclease family protein [Niveispirillum sp.]|uniref:PDDEXK-like family protein n=1 Tax=Niveispirillum sp. TaxID=1917217 RepID=UPI001B3D90EE|nr:PD-(D/E)XK nuclease family protein [Niveispirillum sp.]MBP7338265.1 PD-(D/E)XK nuclease family protein [Niveispirillum sp.]
MLAWFLDPQGDHGCGDGLLRALLLRLRARLGDGFPPAPATGCSVQVEECAPGDRSNRMDITVDDPGFFLIIEVKIDAGEQSWQMERYCDIAVARAAGHRPWAAIYLTRDGRAPDTAGRYKDRNEIVCFSWCDLSGDLRRVAQGVTPIPAFLIRGYADHIATL